MFSDSFALTRPDIAAVHVRRRIVDVVDVAIHERAE